MRRIFTTLLSAGAICALTSATPALAQTAGIVPFVPFAPFASTYAGSAPDEASNTGAPAYSWQDKGPWVAPNGECQIVSGNRVCTANSGVSPLAFGLLPFAPLGYGL
jgi:hypothetical protein